MVLSMGKHYLEDVLTTIGAYVDVLKFAGGSFSLMPRKAVKELLELCHAHNVLVSTGGFIEHILTQGPVAVTRYIDECKRLGFDIVEISTGSITIPTDDKIADRVIGFLQGKTRKLRRAEKRLGKAIFDEAPPCFVRKLGQPWNKWRKIE
jgi:phosphosulfolactate synthase (CoM biosynthesis protein A)